MLTVYLKSNENTHNPMEQFVLILLKISSILMNLLALTISLVLSPSHFLQYEVSKYMN